MTIIVSWFETDDIMQRISVLFIMSCLLGYVASPFSPLQVYQ
jgi:hypothetical protein